MSSYPNTRAELLEAVALTLGRQLSAHTVMFHSAIAQHLGLSPTDHKALDLLLQTDHPLTAGQMASLTGLTTGAVTGIIDRLEKAGYVQRVRSPQDRRQVIIEPIPENIQTMAQLFESLGTAMAKLAQQYSDEELVVIYSYLTQSIEILQRQTHQLQSQNQPEHKVGD